MADVPQPCPGSGKPPKEWSTGPKWQGRCTECDGQFQVRSDGRIRRHNVAMATTTASVGITHEDWQRDVVKLATSAGWKHHHVRKSIGRRNGKPAYQTTTNRPGWPDLLLYSDRGIVAVELKVWPDKPTPEQLEVLADLKAAGAQTFVWYPSDLDEALAVLARRPARRTA